MPIEIQTAIIAAGSALVGALFGGLVPALAEFFMTRRVESRDLKRAARVIHLELLDAWAYTDTALRNNAWGPVEKMPTTSEWKRYQSDVAPSLSDVQWGSLAIAYQSIGSLNYQRSLHPSDVMVPLDAEDVEHMKSARKHITEAIVAFGSLAFARPKPPKVIS